MLNMFNVKKILRLPNGQTVDQDVSLAIYDDKLSDLLVVEYKTVHGGASKLLLNPVQREQLREFLK